MEILNIKDIAKTNTLYGIQMWGILGGGTPYDRIPFDLMLKACRTLLKNKVCDVLGLDIDEVISSMSKNWEYYNYSNLEGTVIPYSMYVINENARTWVSNASWYNNTQCGGMWKSIAYISLNDLIDFNWDYMNNPRPISSEQEKDAVYIPTKHGNTIRLWAKAATTCFSLDGHMMKNDKRRELELEDVIHFAEIEKLKNHCDNSFKGIPHVSKKSDYKFFDNGQECKEHVASIFNKSAINSNRSIKIIEEYSQIMKTKKSLEQQLKQINKKAKKLENEYITINGTVISI